MIPRPIYTLPGQVVIFERGPAQGLPAALATITTGWFDVYSVLAGDIVAPQTGAIVSANDESITGTGTVAHVGAYFLDLYVEHTNPALLFAAITVEGEIAQALQSAGHPTIQLARLMVPCQDGGTNETRPFQHRLSINTRFVRVSLAYPNSTPTRFSMSAILRVN